MKLGDVLGVWGWYLGICSICTKFGADLCVFPAKFAKTRKLNQTFAYNDNNRPNCGRVRASCDANAADLKAKRHQNPNFLWPSQTRYTLHSRHFGLGLI